MTIILFIKELLINRIDFKEKEFWSRLKGPSEEISKKELKKEKGVSNTQTALLSMAII